MTLNSKSILLSALFVLGFAAESSAATGVFAYACGETEDGFGPIECSLGQYATAEEASANGMFYTFETWTALVESLNSQLGWDMPSNASDLQMFLATDLDMGGYVVDGSDTVCANGFVPIDFEPFQKVLSVFDGGSHVISNFCQIESQGDAGFFRNIPGTVRNLTFDGAYVKAEGNAANAVYAGVVASIVNGAIFSDVTVQNAVVRSSSNAGGIAGSYVFTSRAQQWQRVYVNADLRAPVVGGAFGSVACNGAQGSAAVFGFAGITVNVEIGSGNDAGLVAGGIAGQLSGGKGNVFFGTNEVSVVINDNSDDAVAGGLVGNVSFSAEQSANFFNESNTVDMFLNTAGNNVYAGGVAGVASLANTAVADSLNEIRVVLSSKGTGEGDVFFGGEFGQVLDARNVAVNLENVDARLVATGGTTVRLGGIAGNAHLEASGSFSVKNSEVRASIESKETGKSEVAMGGLIAYITESTDSDAPGLQVVSDSNNVTVSMKAASTGDIYAGGILGYAKVEVGRYIPAGGFRSSKSTISAPEGENLITLTASSADNIYAGGVVGKIDSPQGDDELRRAKVQGDIDVSATSLTGNGAVGGLMGEMLSRRTFVYDNFNLGNIHAKVGDVGFALGKLSCENADDYPVEAYANIHYGTDDPEAKNVLGAFVLADAEQTSWNNGQGTYTDFKYNISYNYRNSIESGSATLPPTGKLDLNGSGAILAGGESPMNGVLDDSTMRSRLLVYVLSNKTKDLYAGQGFSDVLDSLRSDAGVMCWDNEPGSLPFVCSDKDERTVYQVQIDVSSIYSRSNDGDNESLKGILYAVALPANDFPAGDSLYSLIGYTENDRRLGDDFLMRARTLSAKYGVVDVNSGSEDDLGLMTFSDNRTYAAEQNFDINVAYELAVAGEVSTYVSLEDNLLDPIYLWPKVTQIDRYGTHAMVPPVFMLNDGIKQEYYLSGYYLDCLDDGGNCNSELRPARNGGMAFSSIIEEVGHEIGTMYGTTIHLVYAQSSEYSSAMEISVSGDANRMIWLSGYGYGKNSLVLFDSIQVGGNGSSIVKMASEYRAKADAGFELNKWKVDFWAYSNANNSTIEQCYEVASEYCSSAVTFQSSANYFARPGAVLDAVEKYSQEGIPLKWSAELDSSDALDMDSIFFAFSKTENLDVSLSYHLHVTPVVTAIPYTISFVVDTSKYPIFVGGYTDTLAIYSRETSETAMLPMLHSTKACFAGWGDKATEPSYIAWDLNEYILGAVSPYNGTFSLYAMWGSNGTDGADKPEEEFEGNGCNDVNAVPLALQYLGENGSERGRVYLWQNLVNPFDDALTFRHDFENDTLKIPNTSDVLRFHVGAEAKPGYTLSYAKVVVENQEMGFVDTLFVDILRGNDMFALGSNYVPRMMFAKFGEFFYLEFDVNAESDVFYDEWSNMDSLMVVEDGEDIEMPSFVYTADSCVLGWSVEAGSKDIDYASMDMADGSELFKKLHDTKTLHAVWADAATCVDEAGYMRVKSVAQNGRIELVEEGIRGTSVHRFGAGDRMLLPGESGGYIVRVVADKGYRLDRIELVQEGETLDVENGEWLDNIMDGAEIRAYFIESDEPLESDGPVLVQSGNAVQFSFLGRDFVKGSNAWVRVSLENDDGDIIDDPSFQCSYDGCNIWWSKFPLKGGDYLFTALMFDGVDTTVFERDFEVVKEIAVGNSWHMVSLANVDMDGFGWNGDEKVYWWNEQLNYGRFWQYQELTQKGSPEQGLGYWYSSVEGKPLKLNEEAIVAEMEWKLDSVYSGWNLVANPYGWYADLHAEHVDSAAVKRWLEEEMENREDVDQEWLEEEMRMMLAPPVVEFWRWDAKAGEYKEADILKPYEAVWAKVNDKYEGSSWYLDPYPVYVDTLGISGEAEGTGNLDRNFPRALAKSARGSGWALRAILSDAKGKRDSWNMLGVCARAWGSEEPPAGMGDRVNLTILDGGKRLAKSVKASSAASVYEWQVELSATGDRAGFLEIAGMESLQEQGLHVFVTVDGKTLEMRSGEKIPVSLTAVAKTASIRVAPSAKQVAAGALQGVRALQVGRMLEVSFDAPAGLKGARSRVEVFDTKGVVVASTAFTATEGKNTVSLETPRRGLYVVRVAAQGQASVQRVLLR